MGIITGKAVPRRTFLRGLGATAVALPFLDAMVPAFAAAQGARAHGVRLRAERHRHAQLEHRATKARSREFPRMLKPLEPFKNDILLLGNLTHNTGRALLDGAGDHGRCCGSYLTGIQVEKTTIDIKAGVSCDQIVANKIGGTDALPVARSRAGRRAPGRRLRLRLLLRLHQQSGVAERDAAAAADSRSARAVRAAVRRRRRRSSPKRRARQRQVPPQHPRFRHRRHQEAAERASARPIKRKLDEYLSSIREVERQLIKAESDNAQIDPGMDKPYGVPADFAEHFKLMTDMMTIAFQADLTRVVTFLVTREGTSRAYREIGIPDGHHPLHAPSGQAGADGEGRADQRVPHASSSPAGCEKLKSIKEGDSDLLDNSMIVYGAGLSDGNRHLHEDLPTLLIGQRRRLHQAGRRVVYPQGNADVATSSSRMMDRMGVHVEQFGDASGPLDPACLT